MEQRGCKNHLIVVATAKVTFFEQITTLFEAMPDMYELLLLLQR